MISYRCVYESAVSLEIHRFFMSVIVYIQHTSIYCWSSCYIRVAHSNSFAQHLCVNEMSSVAQLAI
jgi:hypothetical protein